MKKCKCGKNCILNTIYYLNLTKLENYFIFFIIYSYLMYNMTKIVILYEVNNIQ